MNFDIVNPANTEELLSAIRKFRNRNFRFGAGCTDLLMELKKKPDDGLTVINLSGVVDPAFTGIKKTTRQLRLGAMVTAHRIVMNEDVKKDLPVLHEAALSLASTQIRHVATVGGNICTASPSGDIACAMVALGAQCEILSASGAKRKLPISGFFLGPRRTDLKKDEILYGIYVPLNDSKATKIKSGFIKVGTRRSMECSVVSLAYHLQVDADGQIIKAGIAIGASAPTIRFAKEACDFLIGKKWSRVNKKDKEQLADLVLSYASPITDIRATSAYRKEVIYNISKSIME